jgi:hypothetical protein
VNSGLATKNLVLARRRCRPLASALATSQTSGGELIRARNGCQRRAGQFAVAAVRIDPARFPGDVRQRNLYSDRSLKDGEPGITVVEGPCLLEWSCGKGVTMLRCRFEPRILNVANEIAFNLIGAPVRNFHIDKFILDQDQQFQTIKPVGPRSSLIQMPDAAA